MRDLINQGIEAILPVYIENRGNSTLIYTRDKEDIIDKSCKSVIKNICRHYHLDIKASNEFYGNILSIKKHHPLPLSKDFVMIQAKTRIPLGKHDGAYGYINIAAIKEIRKSMTNEDRCIIYLRYGQEIEIHCKKSTLDKRIKHGHIVQSLISPEKPSILREGAYPYDEGNSPATKKDIALVYMKLEEISKGIW